MTCYTFGITLTQVWLLWYNSLTSRQVSRSDAMRMESTVWTRMLKYGWFELYLNLGTISSQLERENPLRYERRDEGENRM